jgi:MFS transporter, ACDE family, multidrug resistance protein
VKSQPIRTHLGLVYIIAGAALAGIQAILPALPAIQTAFGIDNSQVALVTSLFLLPSVLLTVPMGMLADRIGRRRVLSCSLFVFGSAGLAMAFMVSTFSALLAWRVVQGAAFAAILPLTITLIGDALSGAEQIASQGRRSVVMFAAEALLPVTGGALVLISWSAPFALQAITLPLAVLAWYVVPDVVDARSRGRKGSTQLVGLLRRPGVMALGGLTFSRFFFKFAFLTYLPVLLVTNRGMAESFAGVVLGVFAASGLVAAVVSGRLARHATPARWIGIGLFGFGISLALLAVEFGPVAVLLLASIFGLADGLSGVFINGVTAEVASADVRASFVAVSGTVRNTGKFLAPSVLGLLVLRMRLDAAFVVVSVAAFASLALVPLLKQALVPSATRPSTAET